MFGRVEGLSRAGGVDAAFLGLRRRKGWRTAHMGRPFWKAVRVIEAA